MCLRTQTVFSGAGGSVSPAAVRSTDLSALVAAVRRLEAAKVELAKVCRRPRRQFVALSIHPDNRVFAMQHAGVFASKVKRAAAEAEVLSATKALAQVCDLPCVSIIVFDTTITYFRAYASHPNLVLR